MGWLADTYNAFSQYGFQKAAVDLSLDSAARNIANAYRSIDSVRNDNVVTIRPDVWGSNYYDSPTNTMPDNQYAYAINFNRIIDAGKLENQAIGLKTYSIDLDAGDSFSHAMSNIRDRTFTRINDSPELKALLDKGQWAREDRVAWEAGVSQIVSEEVDKIPGLGSYRTVTPLPGYTPEITAQRDIDSFNDLSHDIENNTTVFEFDCDKQALVEGIVLQQVDNAFLPETGITENDYKTASNYFHVTSDVDMTQGAGQLGLGAFAQDGYHSYIMSSATANIIEATSDPTYGVNAYIQAQEGFTFEDFVDGQIFVERGGHGLVYGGHLSGGEPNTARYQEQQRNNTVSSSPVTQPPPDTSSSQPDNVSVAVADPSPLENASDVREQTPDTDSLNVFTWQNTETESAYGGHDFSEENSLGGNVELGDRGQLKPTHDAVLKLADTAILTPDNTAKPEADLDVLRSQKWQMHGESKVLLSTSSLQHIEYELQRAGIHFESKSLTAGSMTAHTIEVKGANLEKLDSILNEDTNVIASVAKYNPPALGM